VLDPDELLRQTVDLVRERFGLYYVGLFLVDERNEWAVLRAGTGEPGRRMLARGHRLRVGEGMIGWSVANAEARVALEASEDAVRLASEELPDTRSEAALPLRSRGRVLGALTVQHAQPGAFDQDAVLALQTMADRVAVALDNADLLARSQAALEAQRQAYGEISREAWAEMVRARPNFGYRADERGVVEVGGERVELGKGGSAERSTERSRRRLVEALPELVIPVRVRGSVIGNVVAHKSGEVGGWTEEERALLETLVDNLDIALDSARLYRDTQRRAVREQILRQTTDRVRAQTNLDAVLRAAVEEMRRAVGATHAVIRLETGR
jgi:GAF domain-containing protein